MIQVRVQIRRMVRSVRFILRHPLTRRKRVAALWRYVRFHVRHMVFPRPAVYPWLGGLRVLADRGLELGDVVGNLYAGLADFEEMGFLLHFLRPGDLFVDVGANVGMYTMLASGVCQAKTVAVEPAPQAWKVLMPHVYLNGLDSRVEAHPVALGASAGRLPFRGDLGTMSRIASEKEVHGRMGQLIHVPVVTLDALLGERVPTLIKVDVEGYESQVLHGALKALRGHGLKAVIIQMVYGNPNENHEMLFESGFRPAHYDHFTRSVSLLDCFREDQFNTLYLRELDFVEQPVLAESIIEINGVRL